MDSTAVGALLSRLSFAVDSGGAYANRLGLHLLTTLNLGIFRSLFRPMKHVGDSGSERKYDSGYQYQYWTNTAMPTTLDMRKTPDLDRRLMAQLRPPESSMPAAMMAPILHMASSCLSPMSLSSVLRNGPTRLSGCCISTRDVAISAPCRTKSTASVVSGSSIETASLSPVDAHATPTAMAAPYRTCGLYDSARRETTLGHCSGVAHSTKPRHRTAERLTSSETSDTAMCSSRLTAALEPVPRYASATANTLP
mmetsp:Transcript_13371/g.46277  ORF Transcript_13371/g.46277 Transcript_13371/m.46277 type:complete len:253 (-) Transcript_13371:147-905(-)